MKTLLLATLTLCFALAVKGQDRYFAQTYTSNVLAKGGVDIELWHTSRFGHEIGFYHAIDQRIEFEVGLGNKLQTAFYFNRFQTMSSSDSAEIITKNEIGFSNEWKYQLSRSTSKFGVALYGELGIKGDEIEWEGKFIIDRAIGKNLFAFNLVGEIEHAIKKVNGKYKFEISKTPVQLDFGYMRYLHPDFGLGFELKNNNRIEKGVWQNSVLFGGPTLNYRTNRWFVIANYLPQLTNLRKTSFSPKNKVLDTNERTEARIIIGFSF